VNLQLLVLILLPVVLVPFAVAFVQMFAIKRGVLFAWQLVAAHIASLLSASLGIWCLIAQANRQDPAGPELFAMTWPLVGSLFLAVVAIVLLVWFIVAAAASGRLSRKEPVSADEDRSLRLTKRRSKSGR
jgi:hypothetical protein